MMMLHDGSFDPGCKIPQRNASDDSPALPEDSGRGPTRCGLYPVLRLSGNADGMGVNNLSQEHATTAAVRLSIGFVQVSTSAK